MTTNRYQSEPRLRFREWAALVLLLFGGFAVLIGWIVGAVLLWTSNRWTTGQKLLGSLIWPSGFVVVYLAILYPQTVCSSHKGPPGVPVPGVCVPLEVPLWWSIPILAFLTLPPLFMAIYLIRSASTGPRELTFTPARTNPRAGA